MVGTRNTSQHINTAGLSNDGKKIVELISNQLETLRSEFRTLLEEKNTEITSLKHDINVMKSRMNKMEEKLSDSESQIRRNNVIFSGNDVPSQSNGENCVTVIRNLVETKLNLIIPSSDIVSANRIGKRKNDGDQPQRSSILVKFSKYEVKQNLVACCKATKPKFFVNEDLTPEKQTMMFVVRQAKRKHPNTVTGCACIDGRIYAWVKLPNESSNDQRDRRICINSLEKLKSFCTDTVGFGLETFINNWPY